MSVLVRAEEPLEKRGEGGVGSSMVLKEQRCVFSCRLLPLGELPQSGHDAVGQRGEVVARVEDVGLATLPFLQPHEVRAGREERPRALAVQLQDDTADAKHHPHRDHGVVCVRGERRFQKV